MSERKQMVYEFNLDGLTIGDYLGILKAPSMDDGAELLMGIIARCTNTEVLRLPFTEYEGLINQFNQAFQIHCEEMHKRNK